MKNTILFLLAFGISLTVFAQERLLSHNDIVKKEKKVVNTFEKLQKKPNSNKRKKRFVKAFNNSIAKNTSQLITLKKNASGFEPNYEAILNKMNTLQFLYEVSTNPIAKNIVKADDYSQKIDSITNVATQNLYRLGKELIEKNENPFSYMAAYNYLTRVENLYPNYLNTRQLIEEVILKGQKQVYFSPVTYDNLGSFVEFGFGSDKSSMSSDFIIKNIINELQIDNPNTTFVKNSIEADWTVHLKWESVNMGDKRFREYTEERSTEIKENGKENTVKATVKYVITTIDVSGKLNYQIKDKHNNVLVNRTISGFSPFSKKEATYTGDKRALTHSDLSLINSQPSFVNDHYDLLTKMYLEVIHSQLMADIGPLLNWNYITKND